MNQLGTDPRHLQIVLSSFQLCAIVSQRICHEVTLGDASHPCSDDIIKDHALVGGGGLPQEDTV